MLTAALCLSSGSTYPRSESGNELDMDLGEDDKEGSMDAYDKESSNIEEDRCVSSAGRDVPSGAGSWLSPAHKA